MKRLIEFFKTTLLGGVMVILPITLLIAVLTWIFDFVNALIQPLTQILVRNSEILEILANLMVIALILLSCFSVGLLVRTRIGRFAFQLIENNLLKHIPGFQLIKETIVQLIGTQKSPFSSVALVKIFGNDTRMTAFITDEHSDGSYTVFVPTGPNPTSGNIYHIHQKYVQKSSANVQETLKSIISCGAGSKTILSQI